MAIWRLVLEGDSETSPQHRDLTNIGEQEAVEILRQYQSERRCEAEILVYTDEGKFLRKII